MAKAKAKKATKADYMDALDAAGVEYDPKAKVAELAALAAGVNAGVEGVSVPSPVRPSGRKRIQNPAWRDE